MQPSQEPEKLYTAEELAKILKVSRSFAYDLMRTEKIRFLRFGRLRRVRQSDINEYMEKQVNHVS